MRKSQEKVITRVVPNANQGARSTRVFQGRSWQRLVPRHTLCFEAGYPARNSPGTRSGSPSQHPPAGLVIDQPKGLNGGVHSLTSDGRITQAFPRSLKTLESRSSSTKSYATL